mgnify:FL=1|nr:MAG TPA: holin [Caudoviricetes sp.]
MHDLGGWWELLKLCALGATFGLVGGVVRVMRKGVLGWLDLLTQIVVSAFCGVLAFSLLADEVPDIALVGLCGIAGNSGGILLDALRFRLIKRMYDR